MMRNQSHIPHLYRQKYSVFFFQFGNSKVISQISHLQYKQSSLSKLVVGCSQLAYYIGSKRHKCGLYQILSDPDLIKPTAEVSLIYLLFEKLGSKSVQP